jgi:hypothetical protein
MPDELGFITVGFKPVQFLGGLRGFVLRTHHLMSLDVVITEEEWPDMANTGQPGREDNES